MRTEQAASLREQRAILDRALQIARDILDSEIIGIDPPISRDECILVLAKEMAHVDWCKDEDDPANASIAEEHAAFLMGFAFGQLTQGVR